VEDDHFGPLLGHPEGDPATCGTELKDATTGEIDPAEVFAFVVEEIPRPVHEAAVWEPSAVVEVAVLQPDVGPAVRQLTLEIRVRLAEIARRRFRRPDSERVPTRHRGR